MLKIILRTNMPNTLVTGLLTSFLFGCSVEDPYETGPSEQQQKELAQRKTISNDVLPVKLDLKDVSGKSLSNVEVRVLNQEYFSDTNGLVLIDTLVMGNYSIELNHPDYYFSQRTINVSPNNLNLTIQLEPKSSDEISIIFAGDTMFGRRFMDPNITTMNNSVPNLPDAIINSSNASAAAIDVTSSVASLFKNSDFASVNLESTVLDQPVSVHPTKEFSFFSLPATLDGLTAVGVDYVALGNNHVYDYQLSGLNDTLKFVSEAKLSHSGAGLNSAEAFSPAFVTVNDTTTLGLISATSIRGTVHDITYIADDIKGGAADLTNNSELENSIQESVNNSDFTIVQLHGGDEYSYAQTDYIENRYNKIANFDIKPDFMVTHHPHIAQGFAVYEGIPTLLGLGNFVFDQNRLETVLGLAVEIRVNKNTSPKVTSAKAYPIYIDEYKPRLLSGDLSNYLIKRVAEFSSNVTVIPKQGYAEVLFNEEAIATEIANKTIELNAGEHIIDLRSFAPSESFLSDISIDKNIESVTLGRDILAFGDFEDWDNDLNQFELNHWDYTDEDIMPCLTGAYHGLQGICMTRDQYDNTPLIMPFKQTVRAFPVTPADNVSQVFSQHTLFGYMKGINAGKIELDLSILTAEDSLLFSEQRFGLSEGGEFDWQAFNIDFTLPDDKNVLGPENLPARGMRFAFIHSPPKAGNAELQLDDIALISWQEQVIFENGTWQTGKLHGKVFLKVLTEQTVKLNLTFSKF